MDGVSSSPMVLTAEYRCADQAMRQRVGSALAQGCSCRGGAATLKRRRKAHNGIVVTLQCETCGRSLTGDLPRAAFPFYLDLPEWDAAKKQDYRVGPSFEELQATRSAERAKKRDAIREAYTAFRQTPDWIALRWKVLERARYRCEACGDAPAEHVHHLTYDRGLAPPLWLLRGVCKPCHERLHSAADAWHDPFLPARD